MTVDQIGVIDFLGSKGDEFTLGISDHLDWENEEHAHLHILRDKINNYLGAIESGEVFQKFPDGRGKNISINVYGKYPLSDAAAKFYEFTSKTVGDAGYQLQFILSP